MNIEGFRVVYERLFGFDSTFVCTLQQGQVFNRELRSAAASGFKPAAGQVCKNIGSVCTNVQPKSSFQLLQGNTYNCQYLLVTH